MENSIQKIYESHHLKERPQGFSIMESDRANLLKRYIGTGKRILDIGCRDGVLTKHFVSGNDVLGVDIDNISLNKAQDDLGIKIMHLDLNGGWTDLNNQKFDVIVAGEILEHLYYPDNVIKKVFYHLEKDGIFIGSVPNAFSLKNRLRYLFGTKRYTPLSDPTHINQFSFGEMKSLLGKYFANVKVIGLGRFKCLSKIFPSLVSFDLFFVCKK